MKNCKKKKKKKKMQKLVMSTHDKLPTVFLVQFVVEATPVTRDL